MSHHHQQNGYGSFHQQNGPFQQNQQQHQQTPRMFIDNGFIGLAPSSQVTNRLRSSPQRDHQPDNYEGLNLEFNHLLFSSLEQYMPTHLLNRPRDMKARYMTNIIHSYLPEKERIRIQKQKEYRQKIISNYPPLYKEIYSMHAENFFVPSFLEAIKGKTEESFRRIMEEPSNGIYMFEMLQPSFCQMLVSEVEHFERWCHETKFRIMRPNTMNHYGAVLDDLGMEKMLDRLMNEFIKPISQVFFTELGGNTLDSHHGFVVEYGTHRDVEVGFHVDDSEVTLNVCLGNQFSGGELFFRGVRCENHVSTEAQPEEIFDYSHVPGRAVLHGGRHRHGARPTTSGNRLNLILWCRSSVFREMRKYLKGYTSWCGECRLRKREKERLAVAATKQELLRMGLGSFS